MAWWLSLALMAAQDTGQSGPTGEPSAPVDREAAAKAEIAYWQQVEAAAKAKTAALEAQIAEQKKIFGAIPGQTSITGASTTEGTGAAKAEAMLLVTRAADSAASAVAQNVGQGFCQRERTDPVCNVLIVKQMLDLSTAPVDLFEFQHAQLENLLSVAIQANRQALDTAPHATGSSNGRSLFPAIGAGMEFASKLGSYFLTDYKFGSVEVQSPDMMVTNAVAGALNRTRCCFFTPDGLASAEVGPLIAQLQPLATSYADVVRLSNESKVRAAQLLEKEPAAAARLTAAAGLADAAAASYKGFVDGLVTVPTGGGEAPLTRILRARAVRDKLSASARILVLTDKVAAAYYTKKNLWTFLGGPPLYTMGGIAISYSLLDGQTRRILASGSVAKHGGYRSVDKVEKLFK